MERATGVDRDGGDDRPFSLGQMTPHHPSRRGRTSRPVHWSATMSTVANLSPGLRLNAEFYAEVVATLVVRWPHAAARIGSGSEVLGFDDRRSTDHGWGPRLLILVGSDHVDAARRAVEDGLPEAFAGWPVRYGWDDTPVRHHVDVTTLAEWLVGQLGVDPTAGLRVTDWLLLPQQKLLEVTAGAVYHDDAGDLTNIRDLLSYYPEAVWLWMLACQWRRVAQEEAFVGRAADVGDDLGSRLIAARLVRELMRLWFLLHRTYWPYTKWFGSAFRRLPDSGGLASKLEAAVAAADYPSREAALVTAYELVARCHNDLGVTPPIDTSARDYYGRPYRVLMADRFAEACMAQVDHPLLRQLRLVGSVDQAVDSTDLLSDASCYRSLADLYGC